MSNLGIVWSIIGFLAASCLFTTWAYNNSARYWDKHRKPADPRNQTPE